MLPHSTEQLERPIGLVEVVAAGPGRAQIAERLLGVAGRQISFGQEHIDQIAPTLLALVKPLQRRGEAATFAGSSTKAAE